MKSLKVGLMLAAAALAVACSSSSPTINTDYNPSTNFTQYTSFGFKAVDPIADPIVDARIKDAVTSTLTAKGLTRNDQNPGLWVVPHIQLSEQTQLNTYNTGWGYGWRGWGGGPSTTTVEKIPIGTVIIDLVDANAMQLVWRGTGSNTIQQGQSPEQRQQALNQAMQQLFANFPPGSAPAKK